MLTLLVMCAGMFLVQLDVTAIAIALGDLGADLHSGTTSLRWVVSGYTLALAATLLPGGALADRFGSRRIVIVGLGGFGVTSLLAGLAPTMPMLVAARGLQGIAAGVLLPSTLAVINQTFSAPTEKARAIGIWAGVSAVALPAGPLLGGALVEWLGWRSVFLINVPIVVVAAAAIAWVAAAGDGDVRRSSVRLVPRELMKDRSFRVATLVSALMNFVGIGLVFVLSITLQSDLGYSALVAGVRMLPLFVPLAVIAPLTGRLARRVGSPLIAIAGLCVGSFGCAILAVAGSSYGGIAVGSLALGTGMGLLTPSIVSMAMQASPTALSGAASAINNAARQAGGAAGVACFGLVMTYPSELAVCAIVSAILWILAAVVLIRLPVLLRSGTYTSRSRA